MCIDSGSVETTPGLDDPVVDIAGTIDAVEPSGHYELAVEPHICNSDTATAPVAPPCPQTEAAEKLFPGAEPIGERTRAQFARRSRETRN